MTISNNKQKSVGNLAEPSEKPATRKTILDVLAELESLGPEDHFPEIDDTLLPLKEIEI